jgi:glycerol-3-phosphate acyltransferase PlsY
MTPVLFVAGAYLFGAIPTSYIVGRMARGVDLREQGSKNLGATNVFRVLGWRYAVPVALFDILKGALPVWLAVRWTASPAWAPLACGVAAVLGHVFSPYVGFKGGKGVATAAGVFLGFTPLAMLIALGVWGVTLWLSGYVSLSSILAALSFPAWIAVTGGWRPVFWASIPIALFIVYAHRANLRRLRAGTENRFHTRRGLLP